MTEPFYELVTFSFDVADVVFQGTTLSVENIEYPFLYETLGLE